MVYEVKGEAESVRPSAVMFEMLILSEPWSTLSTLRNSSPAAPAEPYPEHVLKFRVKSWVGSTSSMPSESQVPLVTAGMSVGYRSPVRSRDSVGVCEPVKLY